MAVSEELLCSFELLKPLDSSALKNHIKKGRNKRNNMLNSPVSLFVTTDKSPVIHQPGLTIETACFGSRATERVTSSSSIAAPKARETHGGD